MRTAIRNSVILWQRQWVVAPAIIMGQPNTMPPTSVKVTCSSDPVLLPVVGQESKGLLQYGVTSTTFSLYEVPLNMLLTFTLQ